MSGIILKGKGRLQTIIMKGFSNLIDRESWRRPVYSDIKGHRLPAQTKRFINISADIRVKDTAQIDFNAEISRNEKLEINISSQIQFRDSKKSKIKSVILKKHYKNIVFNNAIKHLDSREIPVSADIDNSRLIKILKII